jgi:hypothetical protein
MVLTRSKNLLKIYDLSKYEDWYDYNFKTNINRNVYKKNTRIKQKKSPLMIKFKKDRKNYLLKIYKNYNSFLKAFYKNFDSISTITLKFSVGLYNRIKLNPS